MTQVQPGAMRDEDVLRRQGQRLTPQRRMILDIMRRAHGHMTVDDVVREAGRRHQAINVATTYRILAWLTEHELVCVTDTGGRDHTYEYLGTNRHHHLICQQCGSEVEVPYDLMTPVIEALRKDYGFEPRVDHQAIFGTCQECQAVSSPGEQGIPAELRNRPV